LLEVTGIDVYYGHIQALRDVSLRVDDGEFVALIGANGAGKTTTLRPVSGTISIDGNRVDKMHPEDVVALGVSHLPEGRGMFPSLTVEENLKMGFYTKRSDRKMWKEGVERVTTLFPRLKERWSQAAGTLSGGEQQMLALGRALLPGPKLLLVDELSLGLAPVVVQQLFQLLKEINRDGTTILLVEQYVNQALRIAHRAYVLEKGSVTIEGNAKDLLESSDVVQASYMGGHVEAPAGNGGSPAPPARKRRTRTRRAAPEAPVEDGTATAVKTEEDTGRE
jgi:branched-chain amino acid transport system ATP-binding protein